MHDVEIPGEPQSNRRPIRLQEQFLDLAPNPLGGKVIQRGRSTHAPRVLVHHEIEARRELDAAEDAQAVFAKRSAVHHPKAPFLQVALTLEWIDQLAGDRIAGHRVDGKVTPARRLRDRQGWVAFDGETLVAATDLGLAAGQRHVNRAKFVDGEALADGVHAAEGVEERAQPIGRKPEHLEIEVLGPATKQLVADPATDDERAPAGRSDGQGQLAREGQHVVRCLRCHRAPPIPSEAPRAARTASRTCPPVPERRR